MSARLSYVWLATRPGLGTGAARVLRAFGSPEAVFAADRAALTMAPDCPLRKAQVDVLCDKNTDEAEQIVARCAKDGIQIITFGDSAYPDRLRAIQDPPLVLYVRGKWPDFDVMPGVAVVGTREATPYGLQTAQRIGETLARAGMVTVSGMALGNDGAAHRGALRAGGLTVAVLAGGVDVCYPPQHRGLMGDILLSGAIISEYPPGTEPRGTHYHARNRIISGLSVATVIVEAPGYRSGALITARAALDQGRDVYAVPGALDAPQSAACNELIEKGEAALLRSPEALVRTYSGLLPGGAASPRAPRPVRAPQKPQPERRTPPKTEPPAVPPSGTLPDGLGGEERLLVELVLAGAETPEDLIARCGLPAPRVMSLLTMLEMDGIVRREKGRLVMGCQ